MMSTNDDGYKDAQALTKWTRWFLWAGITVSVISLGSTALEYQLLTDVMDGNYPGDAAFEVSDTRQTWIGFLQLAVLLSTTVFVLMWIHRANYNVRQLGARELRFSPAGAIGWYFVPLFTLWRPYQAMKEIWQASVNPQEWHRNDPVPKVLPLWWTFRLVSGALGQLFKSAYSFERNSNIDDLIESNIASQVDIVCLIFLMLPFIIIVNRIHKMQCRRRAEFRISGAGGSFPAFPTDWERRLSAPER